MTIIDQSGTPAARRSRKEKKMNLYPRGIRLHARQNSGNAFLANPFQALPALFAVILGLMVVTAQAITFSEDFNSMGNTGTTPPSGWSVLSAGSGDKNTWSASNPITQTGFAMNTTAELTANDAPATTNINGFNALGVSGLTGDRCIATSPTGIAGVAIQCPAFTNTSGNAITSFDISYDIKRFTVGAAGSEELPGFWLFYSVDGGTTWVNVSTLNPTLANIPNTTGITSIPTTTVTLSSPWNAGGNLQLRWVDDNAISPSPDQIIGLDNFTISATSSSSLSVAITSPANTGTVGKSFTTTATASAVSPATIASVTLKDGATILGVDTTSPYSFDVTGLAPGAHTLTAVVTDSTSATATSSPVNITVTNFGALQFDGVDDYVTMGTALPLGTQNLTLECWIKHDPSGAGRTTADSGSGGVTIYPLIGKGRSESDGSNVDCNYTFGLQTDGRLAADFEDFNSGLNHPIVGTNVVPSNVWKHVAVTYDGNYWKLYIDGVLDKSVQVNGGGNVQVPRYDSIQHFGLGSAMNSTGAAQGFFKGVMDEVRMWNVARTQAEIQTTMNSEVVSATGLVGRWGLNETSGSTATNTGSAANVNGALSNGPVRTSGYPFGPQAPTLSITSPVNNATVGTSFTIDATAADSDGSISSVSFYDGATPLGTDTSSPYSYSWINAPTGAHALTAVALDNSGLSTTSNVVNVTVSSIPPPTVSITSPANGATVGTNFTISATASTTTGTITSVSFYDGAIPLGTDTTSPYSHAWTNAAVGSHALTAVALASNGLSTTSSAVNVTAVSSGTLTRGPYLNMPSHNSIVIRWRSSQSIVGRVRYGLDPNALTQSTDEAGAANDHIVRLTGLSPYTRYYYSVGSANDALTPEVSESTSYTPGAPAPTGADYTFRTSPLPGTAVNTRVWIIGDCGRGTQAQANARNAYISHNGGASFTGTRIPDLNLQLGDNAYNSGTDSEYQTGYFNMYANIFRKMPQWSTLGNHDANNGNTNPLSNFPYFDMFTFPTAGECGGQPSGTEHYYSFDYGNIHFVCLDSQASNTTVDNPGTPLVNEDGLMASWLRLDLASTTATWIIAFWHHPPYSKGSHDSDSEGQLATMRTKFNPILENGGVDLVFLGHSHNYERSVLLDSHYGTSGTITAAMKKNSGNGSTTGFTTATNGKIRNAANGFTATVTTGAFVPANGAYVKPLTGPRDHFGAVYNTAGMSGTADSSAIDHPAMYISYNNMGTVNLDVNGNTLTCTFVQSGGATPDNFTIIKQGAADTDGDGIPDAYEIAHGLNRFVAADALLDSDSDGTSNLAEFIFDTESNLSDSYAFSTSYDILNGTNAITFETITGRTYRVLYSNDPLSWLPASLPVAGTGATMTWVDNGTSTGSPPSAITKRFYRVEVTVVP